MAPNGGLNHGMVYSIINVNKYKYMYIYIYIYNSLRISEKLLNILWPYYVAQLFVWPMLSNTDILQHLPAASVPMER